MPGWTGWTVRKIGPAFEQARKLNGTPRDVRSSGEITFNPVASTGLHWGAEKLLTSVICTTVCAVSPGSSVTLCSGTEWFRCAGEPSRWPRQAETPGKPNRWQAWLETFVSSSG